MERSAKGASVNFIQPLVVYRSWVALTALVAAVIVLIFRLLVPTEYVASVALAPTNRADSASDKLAQLSGLASLAGVSVGGTSNKVSDFDRFVYLLRSPDLAAWQVAHRNILEVLYPDRWDARNNRLLPPSGLVNRFVGFFKGESGYEMPTPYQLAKIYDYHLSDKRVMSLGNGNLNQETGMLILSYTDEDKTRASTMLRRIVQDANEILRARAAERATAQAKFLHDKLRDESVLEFRNTLERLYSEQEQTLMLTESHQPFAAEPVSGVELPPERAARRAVLYSLIGAAVGFSLSYFVAILVFNLSRNQQSALEYRRPKKVPVIPTIRAWMGQTH